MGILHLHNRANILGMLLIMLLITTRAWKDQNMPLPTTIQTDDDIV
jgi:hypothetical protein